jgi:hypothetical protein
VYYQNISRWQLYVPLSVDGDGIFLRSRLHLQKYAELNFSFCKMFVSLRTPGLLILVSIGFVAENIRDFS